VSGERILGIQLRHERKKRMKVNLKAERKDDLVIVSIISSNVRLCLSDETNLQRFVDEMMALVTKEQPNLVLDCHNLVARPG
jgi:hypothetical protein